jgi:23S rRNA (pseudouridine1915-N3)-methyltransferase
MKVHLICIGKTDENYLLTGMDKYMSRLKHYVNFRMTVIPDLKNAKNLTAVEQKQKEAALIQKHLLPGDWLVLLDEQGSEFSSTGFAKFLEKSAIQGVQQLVFVIGGPYGIDSMLKDSCKKQISLSKMTFSHQMVRLFFIEQLYRAYTIQRGEPYHHA